MLLELLELLLVYVVPLLLQGVLAVFILHLGVYYGIRRFTKWQKKQ